MLELYNIGLNEADINNIIKINPDIKEVSSEKIQQLLNILKQINCSQQIIKNIIISNPYYLTRIDTNIIKLINKLKELGLSTLNLLFDTNPSLLNKDAFEIDDFIAKECKEYTLEEIADMIDSNPFIIDEI